MNVLVLDIETNLAHDTIWCCVTRSGACVTQMYPFTLSDADTTL
jgi:hypothetical protein